MLNFIRKEVFSGSGFPFDVHIFFSRLHFRYQIENTDQQKKGTKKEGKNKPKKSFFDVFSEWNP